MFRSSIQNPFYPVITQPFEWVINNFTGYTHNDLLESALIPSESETSNEKWSLKMYPAGIDDAASRNYISLFLKLESSNRTEVKAEFEFHLINADNEKEITMKCPQPQTFVPEQEKGFEKFFKRDDLFNRSDQLLPNGTLTISGQVTILNQDELKIPNQSKALDDTELPKYFVQLFESQELTDTTFSIKGIEIKAHKAILAARSDVFRAMFETQMREKLTNTVEITDIEYDVFKAMLHFIYTDEAPKSDMAMELMVAADKYALHRLKTLCERKIYMNVTEENVAEVLYFADLHRCAYLKNHTLDFIVLFHKMVIDTKGWKSLEKTHPNLIAEANEVIRIRKII